MSKQIIAVLLACSLCACGGGGSAPTSGGGGAQPTPAPAGLTTQAFFVIGPAARRMAVMASAGTHVSVPAGFQLVGPVAGGVLTYPDGSTQTTDANGAFSPSSSTYVQQHSFALQTSAVTQPAVKVNSISGSLGTTNVAALAASSSAALGGITVSPNAAEIFSGDTVVLTLTGTDVDDRVVSLADASITWSSAAGATIAPIGGTAQAIYVGPSAAATQTDTITASIHIPGSSATYSSTSRVTTIPSAQGFTVSGTLSNASGAPLANASAVFLADDPPRVYPSFDFYAQGDANGAYTRLLPASAQFGLAALAPGAFSATLAGTSSNEFQTGAAGAGGVANLIVTSGEYDDTKDDASNAFPDPIVSVRDAWLAQELLRPYPFWADSGVLALLAAPPALNAAAAPVGSGLFAHWCYQWQSRSGQNVLTLVENTGTACTSGGNEAFEITSGSTSGSFTFTHYRASSGAYPLGAALSASSNALLVASGSWQQTITGTAAAPAGDTASVQIAQFGPASTGASLAQLSFTYGYTASGTSATMQIANGTLSDTRAGLALASATGSESRSTDASLCAGAASACYSGSAAITRSYAGSATRTYQAQATVDGDGSMSFSVASTNAGDASAVVLPVAPAQTRAGGSCVICSGSPGSLLDVDGQTRIGAFTVSAGQNVLFDLLDTAEGEAPGQPIDALAFAL